MGALRVEPREGGEGLLSRVPKFKESKRVPAWVVNGHAQEGSGGFGPSVLWLGGQALPGQCWRGDLAEAISGHAKEVWGDDDLG